MTASRRPLAAAAVLALLLALPACARFGFGGTSPPPGGIVHPQGDGLILRVEHTNGFVPFDYLLTSLPVFNLMGDGRVIVQGAQAEIYPGPALPPVLVRRLDERGIQAILQAVQASGQLETDHEWLGARSFVADAPDTVFTLHAGGRDVTVRVYALGIIDAGAQGISAEERAAHAALSGLLEQLGNPDSWLPPGSWADPDWQPYRASALRLVVRNADGEAPNPDGLVQQELPWPVTGDPATFGAVMFGEELRCGVVTDGEAGTWYEALSTANQLTRWTYGDHRYQVTVRPMLPDEPGVCPAFD